MTDNIIERNIWVSFLYIYPLISECCTNGYNNWFQHRLRVGSMKTASILLSLPREIQAGWGCFPLYGVGQQRIWLTTPGQFSAVWKPCLLKFKDVCGENNPGDATGTHPGVPARPSPADVQGWAHSQVKGWLSPEWATSEHGNLKWECLNSSRTFPPFITI